eukprot:TRINITY_DN1044_c0_g1_i1.p1 TRINITY_DN1044_c0_g1~~TRINITY_DN1044_c0_g1_i1.p1  ORF type:complete len:330 (-),score=68.58 TRINITY_DN1044_c0_g1_i1:29-1018(-)
MEIISIQVVKLEVQLWTKKMISCTFFDVRKYASCGTCYEYTLYRHHFGTGELVQIAKDSAPSYCLARRTPSFRFPMAYDSVNNRLYWIGDSPFTAGQMELWSFDLSGDNMHRPVFRATWSGSAQMSQITVDCNGAVWWSDIFNGYFVWIEGWCTALHIIDDSDYNGITIIRQPGTNDMRYIIGNQFDLKVVSFSDGVEITDFPNPPIQNQKDIMHVIQWDPQNEYMCINVDTSDGNNIIACYDPSDDPNVIWNYVEGPFPREHLSIRYGQYTFNDPHYIEGESSEETNNDDITDKTNDNDDENSEVENEDSSSVIAEPLLMGALYLLFV